MATRHIVGTCAFAIIIAVAGHSWGANSPFSSSFESGTLLTTDVPAGDWDVRNDTTGCTQSAIASAAHRGSFGYRLVDLDTTAGQGDQSKAYLNLSVSTGAIYSRTWFRVVAASDAGAGYELLIIGANIQPTSDIVALRLIGPGTNLIIIGRDRSGAESADQAAGSLAIDTWYLLEASATGLGTAQGARRVYVNGILAGETTNIDWSGTGPSAIRGLIIGENYADQRNATVTMDYDDVRLDTRPLASTLRISPPATAQANTCVPIAVGLVDSIAAAPAVAPYAVTVDLTLGGVAARLFSETSCTTPTATALIPTGMSTGTVYLSSAATSGVVTVRASHGDFIGASAQVELQPGEEPQRVIQNYRVSCGASHGPGVLAPLALAWVVTAARRRTRTARISRRS